MNNEHIKQCAKELGFEFNDADAEDVVTTGTWAYETVWGAVTDYLNAYESCTNFDADKYKPIRTKWEAIK
jgi:hypothetical protein